MRNFFVVLLALAISGSAGIGVASAQQYLNVVINGSPMTFPDQPPVEQAGRIYVPMRAIFERLGATVVYNNGTINATSGRRTVQLQIGSSYATVNGQQVQLDSPPFEIAARTLVPLRFVSQALGDRVSWDQNRSTAYIVGNGGGYGNGSGNGYGNGYGNNGQPSGPMPPYRPGTSNQRPGPAWADAGHPLVHRPFPWGQTSRPYPLINASFRTPMLAGSIRVVLDGRDVTQIARVTPGGFELTPAFPLGVGEHTVRIFGRTQDGAPVSDGWSFTVVV